MARNEIRSGDGVDSRHDQQPVEIPTFNSPQTKLVYLYLDHVRRATVSDLKQALGINTLSLYPILRLLIDRKLVEQHDTLYVHSKEGAE